MVRAVTTWSPVIILTRMPACWHSATAVMASSRGGSMMPVRPRRVEAGLDVCWGQGFLIGRGGADGDGEQALSEPRGFVQTRVPGALVEGFVAVASALGRAGGEDGFGGAFHDDERLVVVRMEGGHEFVCGVERDGGGAGVSVVQLFGVESGFQAEGDEGTFGWFPFKEPAPVFFPEG